MPRCPFKIAICVGLVLPLAGQAADAPAPVLTLNEREGRVTPHREGFQHTGAGEIDVAQPAPDTIVVTMTGVTVAGPHPCKDSAASMDFDLAQCFEVALDKAEGKKIKLTVTARVIGLLRSEAKGKGTAEESGCVTVSPLAGGEVASVTVPAHTVAAGESLSINDLDSTGQTSRVAPGKFSLHQTFHIDVNHPRALVRQGVVGRVSPRTRHSIRCGSATGSRSTARARRTSASRLRSVCQRSRGSDRLIPLWPRSNVHDLDSWEPHWFSARLQPPESDAPAALRLHPLPAPIAGRS